MLIGVPKEVKVHEYRVGLLPAGVEEMARQGHKILVETHAGDGCGFSDDDYRNAGAEIIEGAAGVYGLEEGCVEQVRQT